MTHDRTIYHKGIEDDLVVILASTIGTYPAGTDVQTVLAGIDAQLRALELLDQPLFTFALNAIRRRAVSGSFTLNAIRRVLRTGSFTLDAVLVRGFSGSFTLNSILKKTITSSFTLNAIRRTIVNGSFTLDAVVASSGLTAFESDAFQNDAFE